MKVHNRALLVATTVLAAVLKGSGACEADFVQYGERRTRDSCSSDEVFIRQSWTFGFGLDCFFLIFCQQEHCGLCFPPSDEEPETGRPYKHLAMEKERVVNAASSSSYTGTQDLLHGSISTNDLGGMLLSGNFGGVVDMFQSGLLFSQSYISNLLSNLIFPMNNYVDGFRRGDSEEDKWNKPVVGERVNVISFDRYVKEIMGVEFTANYPYFADYYTGERVPSWEDDVEHKRVMEILGTGVAASRFVGREPIHSIRSLDQRFAFDNEGLIKATWDGFQYLEPREIKYASNGVYGVAVVERYDDEDTLGVLVTDSVFSAHLTYDTADNTYNLDLTKLEKYEPIEGYARMGGKAKFALIDGRLRTQSLEYDGESYNVADFADPDVHDAFQHSVLTGWRFAEKAIIASMMSLTNLIVHVKDVHMEMAALFQAVSVDAFADDVENPISRLIQPFIHRSIQSTNENFKLLFEFRASEFSLAPLPNEEQLRLIGDFVENEPLRLADLDMEAFARIRNMPEEATREGGFWRWHWRAKTIQQKYRDMIVCFLNQNYPGGEADLLADATVQAWWAEMFEKMPALQRTNDDPALSDWASSQITLNGLENVLSTLFTWVSWIHEDVGHSAASLVYNPVYTPMGVPADGKGIAFSSFNFNAAAYRSFVFLNRAKLLDEAPGYWFSEEANDRQCYIGFQQALRSLGDTDKTFRECGTEGFYSCVEYVETGVSS